MKSVCVCICFVLLFGLGAADTRADVRINEILYNPANLDSTREWVELVNTGPGSVDLTGWILTNASGLDEIPLPPIELPPECYLVVRLQVGPNDFDFSDGNGLYSTGGVAPIFDNETDGCGLFSGPIDPSTTVDYVGWSATFDVPMGIAHDAAVVSGNWPPASHVNTAWGGPNFVEPWTQGPGETLGRDGNSSDTNTPGDWSDHGGHDSMAETEGSANTNPYLPGQDLILVAQQCVNQFLWDFGLNIHGASHTGTVIAESESEVTTTATHSFDIESRVDGTAGTLSGEIVCLWQKSDSISWTLDIGGILTSTRGAEAFDFMCTVADSGVLVVSPSRSWRVADITYTTPLGYLVHQTLDFSIEHAWIDPTTLETVDVRTVNDTRNLAFVRTTNLIQTFPSDPDEDVTLDAVTTFTDPSGAPTEYYQLSSSKHHDSSGEIYGVLHAMEMTTDGNHMILEAPSPFAWTKITPDSLEFDQTLSLGCPSSGYETGVLHGSYGAIFDPATREFVVRGSMSATLGAYPPREITYYADWWSWKKFCRTLNTVGFAVLCGAGAVAASPSGPGAVAVGAACVVGHQHYDEYIDKTCPGDKRSLRQDDIPPPAVDFPRVLCCAVVGVDEGPDGPMVPRLAQNVPNPFNPTTLIEYDLPEASWVKLDIYNIAGQRVVTLVDEFRPSGRNSVVWDGKDEDGFQAASGVYFYRLSAGSLADSKKMILLK